MHSKLLSTNERDIIRRYLEDGTQLQGFANLKSRCKKWLPKILEDQKLLEQFSAKEHLQ